MKPAPHVQDGLGNGTTVAGPLRVVELHQNKARMSSSLELTRKISTFCNKAPVKDMAQLMYNLLIPLILDVIHLSSPPPPLLSLCPYHKI